MVDKWWKISHAYVFLRLKMFNFLINVIFEITQRGLYCLSGELRNRVHGIYRFKPQSDWFDIIPFNF